MAVEGKVYNLSEFQFEHPGGSDILVDVAGREATEEFEDAGHSEDAREMMSSYLVGTLEGGVSKPKGNKSPVCGASNQSSAYLMFGGLAVASVALIVFALMRKQRRS